MSSARVHLARRAPRTTGAGPQPSSAGRPRVRRAPRACVPAAPGRVRARLARSLVAAFAALAARHALAQAAGSPGPAAAAETLFVYGPGGPLPAMRDAASAFERRHGVHVVVTGGPTPQWLASARANADVVFSGAEHMMTDFVRQLADTAGGAGVPPGAIDESTIRPLYLRPVAMLVRPGNPRHVRRFEDLLRPGVRVLVVQGAGQTGLWEDVAGRTGDIGVVRAFRRNIAAVAPNTGAAKERWTSDPTLDAWLVWNVWQVANPTIAEAVPVAERWRIYRDAGAALTRKGRDREPARRFVAFLESPEGARVFARWGWMTAPPRPGR